MPGVFITFEGGEGTGKSSHARDLAEALRKAGRTVVLTREPGGSPSAEEVRALLVTGAVGRWSADAEALLNYAARDSHLRETIRPALAPPAPRTDSRRRGSPSIASCARPSSLSPQKRPDAAGSSIRAGLMRRCRKI